MGGGGGVTVDGPRRGDYGSEQIRGRSYALAEHNCQRHRGGDDGGGG